MASFTFLWLYTSEVSRRACKFVCVLNWPTGDVATASPFWLAAETPATKCAWPNLFLATPDAAVFKKNTRPDTVSMVQNDILMLQEKILMIQNKIWMIQWFNDSVNKESGYWFRWFRILISMKQNKDFDDTWKVFVVQNEISTIQNTDFNDTEQGFIGQEWDFDDAEWWSCWYGVNFQRSRVRFQ